MGGSVGVDSKQGEGSHFWFKTKLQILDSETRLYPYANISGYESSTMVVLFETRDYVKRFLYHYFHQWNCQVLFFTDIKPSSVVDVIRNCKTIKAAVFGLASTETNQVAQAISVLKSKVPGVLVIAVDTVPSAKLQGEHDGVLLHPLSFLQLYNLLCGERKKPIASVSSDKPPLKRLQLLLAEDNKPNQYIATSFLKSLGHTVDIVDNGSLAVRAVQEKFYDAVLMDVMMPVMDGITATIQIRNYEKVTGRHIPIIALTAASESLLIEECMKCGMDSYLFKPFKKVDLETALQKATQEQNMSDQIST